jgi:hypothetical protein
MSKAFTGRITTTIKPGMKVQIQPDEFDGRIHKGKEFVVAGDPRGLCGTEVVALHNLDGSRFSAAYDLSMLEITDINTDSMG